MKLIALLIMLIMSNVLMIVLLGDGIGSTILQLVFNVAALAAYRINNKAWL